MCPYRREASHAERDCNYVDDMLRLIVVSDTVRVTDESPARQSKKGSRAERWTAHRSLCHVGAATSSEESSA